MKHIQSFIQHLPEQTDSNQLLDELMGVLEAVEGVGIGRIYWLDSLSDEYVICRSFPGLVPSGLRAFGVASPLISGYPQPESEESAPLHDRLPPRQEWADLGATLAIPMYSRMK